MSVSKTGIIEQDKIRALYARKAEYEKELEKWK